mmetsp:Transcript_61754/g.108508  ORF Transcript_61754/g.108508 Transcript_61754/m.108508 type:complete len:220 (-) Transcript_61754:3151-3810(-)
MEQCNIIVRCLLVGALEQFGCLFHLVHIDQQRSQLDLTVQQQRVELQTGAKALHRTHRIACQIRQAATQVEQTGTKGVRNVDHDFYNRGSNYKRSWKRLGSRSGGDNSSSIRRRGKNRHSGRRRGRRRKHRIRCLRSLNNCINNRRGQWSSGRKRKGFADILFMLFLSFTLFCLFLHLRVQMMALHLLLYFLQRGGHLINSATVLSTFLVSGTTASFLV